MPESKDGWTQRHNNGCLEFNPGHENKECRINIGCNQIVEVDKLYGPLCCSPVRVFLEYKDDVSDWVVQYQNLTTEEWEEKARWDCQENWPDDD